MTLRGQNLEALREAPGGAAFHGLSTLSLPRLSLGRRYRWSSDSALTKTSSCFTVQHSKTPSQYFS
jgi:hypothetical protein